MKPIKFELLNTLVESGEMNIQTGPFGTQLKASDYVEEGIPVINVRNIGYRNEKDSDLEYFNDKVGDRLKQHKLKVGDIVFGRKGAVDRHLIVKEKQNGWIQGSDCIRIRFNTNKLNRDFLSYSFLTEGHKKWMEAQGTIGATMGSLNQGIIQRISYPCFPLPIQRKIAAVLSAYDDLIENNNRRIAILEKMAEELYREWFVRLRFPGHEKVKIVKGVPEGWEVKKFKDFCTLQRGFDLPDSQIVNGDFPVIASTSIKAYHNQFKVTPPVITTGRSGSLGTAMMTNKNAWPLNTTLWVKNIFGNSPYFIFYTLKQMNLENFNSGAGVPSLNRNHLNCLSLLVPSKTTQQMFNENISPLLKEKDNLIEGNTSLNSIRDRLLPRLMSGKIDVERLDIKFPASMMEGLTVENTGKTGGGKK